MKRALLALLLGALCLAASGCGYLLLEQKGGVTVYQEGEISQEAEAS